MQNRETETKKWQNSVTLNYLTERYFATYISMFSHICGCANNGQVYSFKDVKYVFVFVTKYGEIHGLVLRRRVQGFKREDVRLLSSFETKVRVCKAHVLSLHDSS